MIEKQQDLPHHILDSRLSPFNLNKGRKAGSPDISFEEYLGVRHNRRRWTEFRLHLSDMKNRIRETTNYENTKSWVARKFRWSYLNRKEEDKETYSHLISLYSGIDEIYQGLVFSNDIFCGSINWRSVWLMNQGRVPKVGVFMASRTA